MDINPQQLAILVILGYSVFGWLVLTGIKINYGRLKSSFSSIDFPPKLGWFLFQVPNLAWAVYFIFYLQQNLSLGYTLFIIHYVNRDIIYPLRLKSPTPVPLQIVVSAFSFTLANGYIQGIANRQSQNEGFKILGVVIFCLGMWINIKSDNILQSSKQKHLKQQGKNKYVKIDKFLFIYISNPNYLGQIIQWMGYAICCNHIYAWLFVFSTINILTPAAMVRSKWNKKNIAGYPDQRKAILPLII